MKNNTTKRDWTSISNTRKNLLADKPLTDRYEGQGVKISLTNSKLGALIPSVNVPPVITCRASAPCAMKCYACKPYKRGLANVTNNDWHNFYLFASDPDLYFASIKDFLAGGLLVFYKYFRFHSSGDIINKDYFERSVKLCEEIPSVTFLMYTKKFEIVNDFIKNGGKIPSNLKVVFSYWDKDFVVPNPFGLPETYVDFKDKTKNPHIPTGAQQCPGSCERCLLCWHLEKGQSVVFHQH